MSTVTYTYLQSGGGEGWTIDGGTSFDSITYLSNSLFFFKSGASPFSYFGATVQSATFKTYGDLGVPVGNKITGIRLLGALTSTIAGSTLSAESIEVFSVEADLGTYNIFGGEIIDNSGGGVISIDKLPSDYLRLTVIAQAQIDFDISGFYSDLQISVDHLTIEITYERISKNKMMFII